MLEEKVCCGNKSTSLQDPARNIEVTSNSREHSSPIQNVTPIEVDHLNVAPAGDLRPTLVDENNAVHSSTKFHVSSSNHNTQNEAELIPAKAMTKQRRSKNERNKCPKNSAWEGNQQIPVIIINRRRKKKPNSKNFCRTYGHQTHHPRSFRNLSTPWQTVWPRYLKFGREFSVTRHISNAFCIK